MINKPMVSIIVPIYNTEEYLRECIESIINQTYTNLEIILVDDGSPDNCGKICDEYAEKDNRVKVIHQENKGLPGARNAGMNAISGDYFSFVDSDDFIVENCIEKLVDTAVDSGSDIIACDNVLDINSIKINFYKKNMYLSAAKVLEDLLYRKIEFGSCCGKLFVKRLKNIPNKNILFVEDQLFIINCLNESSNVFVLSEGLYYYRYNSTSIMHNTKNAKCYFDALVETDNELIKLNQGNELSSPYECLLVSYAFFVLLNITNNEGTKEQIDYCKNIIKGHRKAVLFDRKAAIKTRGACLLSYFGVKPLLFLYKFI